MSGPHSRFYVTGGTLARDDACYVVRDADRFLYEAVSQGKFCYVLTSRQMGKSSLMVRTALRLRAEGTAAVVLDLTAVGQNLTVDQWYDGLLAAIGRQLGIEPDLEEHWARRSTLGPFQRWTTAFSEVVLPRHPRPLVIFVDEIDAVRSLSFSTDEFFAGIRELHNRRAVEPEVSRLTFCLLGVATPSDLVSDPRSTPFNIGERIELTDFMEREAVALAPGLRRSEPEGRGLLSRILYWTGGHPYLTQRLCQAVAEDQAIHAARGVDRVCERLFLTPRSREQDDNLAFVRDRVLRVEQDPAALLTLYGKVRAGERVHDDETNPLVSALRLAGIVRAENGHLAVRNRIYSTVFDRRWVKEGLPDAEVRRQRAAYRKGLLRAATIAALVLALVAGLATLALFQRNRAVRDEQANRELLYAAHINLAHQALMTRNFRRAEDLLKPHVPRPGEEDLRGFEWYYLWRGCCEERVGFRHAQAPPAASLTSAVRAVTFSPDGKTLASGGDDTTVKLWDVTTWKELATLRGHGDTVKALAFSLDGSVLASGATDGTLKLWDVAAGREIRGITGEPIDTMALSADGRTLAVGRRYRSVHFLDLGTLKEQGAFQISAGAIQSVAFSPDGKWLATGSSAHLVEIWDVATGKALDTLTGHSDWVVSVAFSSDGKTLATGSTDHTVRIWNASTREVRASYRFNPGVTAIAFSPSGKLLGVGLGDRTARLIETQTGREAAVLRGHASVVLAVAFSLDGTRLATGSLDNTAKLWSTSSGREIAPPRVEAGDPVGLRRESGDDSLPQSEELPRSESPTYSVAFSPDGRTLATGRKDGSLGLWNPATRDLRKTLRGHSAPVWSVAFSPDSALVATGGDDRLTLLWDSTTGEERGRLRGHRQGVCAVAFSPDGEILVTAGRDGVAVMWDVSRRAERLRLVAGAASVCALAFSPDGKLLATGGIEDRTVKVWNVTSGRLVAAVEGEVVGRVFALAFSPDGRILATGASDSTAKLWEPSRLRDPLILRHDSSVRSMAWSPDGRTLATGTGGGHVVFWDVRAKQELLDLQPHDDRMLSIAFSPDGKTLASTSEDGSVKLWRAATEDSVRARLARDGLGAR